MANWSQAEDDIIIQYHRLSSKKIMHILSAKGYTRTTGAIKNRRDRLTQKGLINKTRIAMSSSDKANTLPWFKGSLARALGL